MKPGSWSNVTFYRWLVAFNAGLATLQLTFRHVLVHDVCHGVFEQFGGCRGVYTVEQIDRHIVRAVPFTVGASELESDSTDRHGWPD